MKKLALFFFLLPLMVNAQEDSVYIVVEKMPVFPGGEEAMFQYFRDNLTTDSCVGDRMIHFTYIIEFIVERDGSLSNIKQLKPEAYQGCVNALDLFYKMPKWRPGEHEGIAVRVKMKIPLRINVAY
jgi:protein TonB